jgi:hypothetical protein
VHDYTLIVLRQRIGVLAAVALQPGTLAQELNGHRASWPGHGLRRVRHLIQADSHFCVEIGPSCHRADGRAGPGVPVESDGAA